ncbi:hypothetical protein NLI96_g13088 [Meripilus lineatus]|uniref:Ams2/SPT21 N-terminal domain-containing protein n=1 Tax=Meripilus lineatus TaxID=2056292 RepID=A0AAD5UNQ8_9APHY|nr:hypothetical protein NLI96_g13088 [Physisporinus lineatus]
MSSTTRLLNIRVLYTINSTPQYILARSIQPYKVDILRVQPSSDIVFGRVSLRDCLDSICRSSPELVPDARRDFSIYLLDPLESHSNAPLLASSHPPSPHHPQGVAIALGLLSWALRDDAPQPQVTGTVSTDGLGNESLEVIFALRETTPVAPPQPRPLQTLVTPVAPPPQLPKQEETTNSTPVLIPPPAPSTSPQHAFLQSILSAIQSAERTPQLLSALALIDQAAPTASQDSPPNLALIEALTSLIQSVSTPSSSQPVRPTTPPRKYFSNASNKSPSKSNSDDEIVVLDKENVNPAAFRSKRKAAEKENSLATPVLPLTSHTSLPALPTHPVTRKRRLSDFMEQREREKEELRKKASNDRRAAKVARKSLPRSRLPPQSDPVTAPTTTTQPEAGPSHRQYRSFISAAPRSSPPRPHGSSRR